jgi:hypothetical protein
LAQGEERLGGVEARSLADQPIVRLILDGTVVRVRLDRKATSISLLIVVGVRADGQEGGARCWRFHQANSKTFRAAAPPPVK